MNTVGDQDFEPLLAQRWEWNGPRTLVFHLNPRAHWQDGQPVTAYPENLLVRIRRLYLKHRTAVLLILTYLIVRVVLIFFHRQ